MKALISFAGFYESAHDADLDDASQGMHPKDREKIDWRITYQNYAKAYAEVFLDMVKVPGTYIDLISPREYNFTTDTIVVEVEEADMQAAFERAQGLGLAELVEAELQERDGFIPFFSNDLEDWGPVADWNEAQCELVMRVLAAEETTNGEWEQQDEVDLMEPARSNGRLEGWLYSSLPSITQHTLTTFDVNVRLSYDGAVPVARVRELLIQALSEARENGLLSEAQWRDEPELSETGCMKVELARPQVVIDMTDPDAFQFSSSADMEVVCISRDPHDVEEAGEPKPYSAIIGTKEKSLAHWRGSVVEQAIVQSIECEVDSSVELLFNELYEGT